jgi:hypothetical protein
MRLPFEDLGLLRKVMRLDLSPSRISVTVALQDHSSRIGQCPTASRLDRGVANGDPFAASGAPLRPRTSFATCRVGAPQAHYLGCASKDWLNWSQLPTFAVIQRCPAAHLLSLEMLPRITRTLTHKVGKRALCSQPLTPRLRP